MKNRSIGATALVSLLLTLPAASAFAAGVATQGNTTIPPNTEGAAQVPPSGTRSEKGIPELVIAGRVVLRLRSRAGGLSAEERAFSLRQRLGPILTLPNLSAEDVTVQQRRSGQTAFIYVRNRLLITVDRNLAGANETSVGGLAAQWVRNLRTALPQVNVTVRMSSDIPLPREKGMASESSMGKPVNVPSTAPQ